MPNVIAPASLFGYVYVSEDGGNPWSKLKKEFGEIRSLAVTPRRSSRQRTGAADSNDVEAGSKPAPVLLESVPKKPLNQTCHCRESGKPELMELFA